MRNSALVTQVTSFLGWTFLPSFLTQFALNGYYTVFPAQRPALPPNPTQAQIDKENARANLHYRVVRGALVVAYLVYTVAAVYAAQSQIDTVNFYTFIGLSREAVSVGGSAVVKAHWRRLARAYHPDKVGPAGEGLFVALRRAVDCLANDEKRWAYERFGPVVLDWQKLVTMSDYMYAGMQGVAVFYVFVLVTVLLAGVFRSDQQPYIHARLYLLLATLAIELSLTVQGAEPMLLHLLFPNRLPYEHVSLIRQLFISSSLALAQLGPLLHSSNKTDEERMAAELQALEPLLQRIVATSEAIATEALALQRVQVDRLVPKPGDSPTTIERKEREMVRFRARVQATVQRIQSHEAAQNTSAEPRRVAQAETAPGMDDEPNDEPSTVPDSTGEGAKELGSEEAVDVHAPLEPGATPSEPPAETTTVESTPTLTDTSEKEKEVQSDATS